MKNKEDNLIVSLDIGSNKIVVVIAELDEYNNIFVLGIGRAETKGGMKGGVIINIESVVSAINQAVEDAEIQAGREVNGVFVGTSGGNIETINQRGVVAISGADKEITEKDINRVLEAAKAVAIPMDREILHIIPQGFIVDGRTNIKYPIGMVGTRLECQVHMLTTPISSIQNLVKCLDRCGLEIYDIVLQNLAASRAVLEDDEKEIGVLMLDIGSDSSKISIYHQGFPYFHSVYPLGGYLITNDIAAGLKVPLDTAEKIKVAFGISHMDYINQDEAIQIPSVGGRKPRLFHRESLVHIIRPRVEEMLNIIKQDITQHGFLDKIQGSIVLTGGTALLPGIAEVAQEVFNVQARVGTPKKMSGLNDQMDSSEYAVANGLTRWGFDKMNIKSDPENKKVKVVKEKGFFRVVKKLFDELF